MRMKKIVGAVVLCAMVLVCLCSPMGSMQAKAEDGYKLSGSAHVQNYGDRNGTFDGSKLTLGTIGKGLRLEAITVNFTNNTDYPGTIQYRVHRQDYGWTGWMDAGKQAGTTGQSKRLEGIQMRLTGELGKYYSIKYRVHIQDYGWKQGWQYDGALAGTEAESKRLESLEVMLVPKTEAMGLTYRVHRQDYGWEMPYKSDGSVSGTVGQAKRLEGIELALTGNQYSGGIEYWTHVQNYGWMSYVQNGMMSGTSGKALRLEAIQIRLTGDIANHYDIYYRVHAQDYGWLDWAKNGEYSGTAGYSKRLEAIQIVLVRKDASCPSSTYNGVTSKSVYSYVSKTGNVRGHSMNSSSGSTGSGSSSGTTPGSGTGSGTGSSSGGSTGGSSGGSSGGTMDPEDCKNHEFERERVVYYHVLIVDPYVEPKLWSRPIGGYAMNWDDDPFRGTESSGSIGIGGTETVHTGTYYIGNPVNGHYFETEEGNLIDLNSLDWYCMHEYNYAIHDVCKKCGYTVSIECTTDTTVLDPWYGKQNKEDCTCLEFGMKQYGVLFFPKDHDPRNKLEIPYSRCKHTHLEDWEVEIPNSVYEWLPYQETGYVRCKDCGAIFNNGGPLNYEVE